MLHYILVNDIMLSTMELQFDPGDTSKCFNVDIVNDDGPEPSEYLDVTYSVVGRPVTLSPDQTRIVIERECAFISPSLSLSP